MRHVPKPRNVSLVSSRSNTSSKSSVAPIPACPVRAAFVERSFVEPPRSTQTRSGTPPNSAWARVADATRQRPSTRLDLAFMVPLSVGSSDGHVFREIDVLNRVQEGDPLLRRALEGFPPRDQPRSAGALVDDRGRHRFGQVS